MTSSVLNGSGRPSLAPGRPRPDPDGQVKYGSGQRGPAVGQAGGRERWRFFRPPLTWADLGPALDPEIRERVVNLQKFTLKSFISWGRVKFCVELWGFKTALKVLDVSSSCRSSRYPASIFMLRSGVPELICKSISAIENAYLPQL